VTAKSLDEIKKETDDEIARLYENGLSYRSIITLKHVGIGRILRIIEERNIPKRNESRKAEATIPKSQFEGEFTIGKYYVNFYFRKIVIRDTIANRKVYIGDKKYFIDEKKARRILSDYQRWAEEYEKQKKTGDIFT